MFMVKNCKMYETEDLKDYKTQLEYVQQQLQQSEASRQELEHQLDLILQRQNDQKKLQRKQNRRRYEQFLEEQRKHSERNKKLMQMLDDIDQQAAALSMRSERLKRMKKHYELYYSNMMQPHNVHYIQNVAPTNTHNKGIPILVPTAAVAAGLTQENHATNSTLPTTPNMTSCQWTLAMAAPFTGGMWLMPSVPTVPTVQTMQARQDTDNSKYLPEQKTTTYNSDKNHDSSSSNADVVENIVAKNPQNDKLDIETVAPFENLHKTAAVTPNPTMEKVKEPVDLPNILHENQQTVSDLLNGNKISDCDQISNITNVVENNTSVDNQADVNETIHTNNVNIELPTMEQIDAELAQMNLLDTNKIMLENENLHYTENNYYPVADNVETEQENEQVLYGYNDESGDAVVEPNYGPTLVTTEAELYSQSMLDTSALSYNQEPQNYDNANYVDYENQPYGETVYPGYTFDETTGEYLMDDTKQQQQEVDENINYEHLNNNFSEPENNAYDYAGYEQEVQPNMQEVVAADAVDLVVEEPAIVPELEVSNTNENTVENLAVSNVSEKSVKPILTTPSASGNNDMQKKKKRVNFLDNSDTDDNSDKTLPAIVSSESDENTNNNKAASPNIIKK